MSEFTPDATIITSQIKSRQLKGAPKGTLELYTYHRRNPVYFDKTFGVRLDILDGGGEYLRHLAKEFPDEFNRALKSIGYQLRGKMVAALRQGGSRSARWQKIAGVKEEQDAAVKGGERLRRTRARSFYGQLGSAGGQAGKSPIAYVVSKADSTVKVGWMSFQSRKLAVKIQAGFDIPVTTKMRRHFFASGLGLDKSTINVPGRPLVQPVWDDEGKELLRKFELRIHAYIRGFSGKNATKYVRDNL